MICLISCTSPANAEYLPTKRGNELDGGVGLLQYRERQGRVMSVQQ